jgi:hypothetical protein
VLDTTEIDRWLQDYLKAWRTDAPDDIVALFEPDARYFTAPFREPCIGHAAITEWWVGQENSTVAWTFDYDIVAAEGRLYVVRGVTTYPEGFENDPTAPEVFDNIWLVTLSDAGKASEFIEYWMQRD